MAVIAVGFTLLSLLDLPAVSSLLLAGALAALGAMPAVVSVQVGIEYWASMYGARGYLTMSLPVRGRVIFAAKTLYVVIAGLVSAAVAALLGVGWLATYVHLRGTTLEELLQAVRQMISMVGAGILVFYGLAVVGGAVVTIIEVAAVMSIGAQGRWNRLVDAGNTVVVIEHNLDVIKAADWIIDMGPGGGSRGGQVVATGTPEEVAKVAESATGEFLAPLLEH